MNDPATLTQRFFPCGGISLSIQDGALKISRSRLLSSEGFSIPLSRIAPTPIYFKRIAWQWVVASMLMLILPTKMFIDYLQGKIDGVEVSPALFVSCVSLFLAALLALQARRQSFDHVALVDSSTGSNLVLVKRRIPSEHAVSDFLAALAEQVRRISYPKELSPDQRLEIYKRHLHFLLEEGVLTNDESKSILERLSRGKAEVVRLVQS